MENGEFFRFAQGQCRTFKIKDVGVQKARQPFSLKSQYWAQSS